MADLNEAVRTYASDLAEKIQSFIKDVATLEVRTYTSPNDQAQTLIRTKDISSAVTETSVALRAGTSVTFNGDVTQLAPIDANGEINQALWQLHQQAVQQATQHRERMMVALGEAAASAIKALRAANG
jgi:hypothetical protein